MAAAVPAGAVAVPGRGDAGARWLCWRRDRRGVTLSNFYGGLIAAVITPIAIAAYWFVSRAARPRARVGGSPSRSARSPSSPRRRSSTRGTRRRRGRATARRSAFARERSVSLQREMVELSRPAGRPSAARRLARAHLGRRPACDDGLLEQQVSLGWSVVALG